MEPGWVPPATREEGEHIVYVIEFYGRCKYFGYTREPVFYRAARLGARIASWGTKALLKNMQHRSFTPSAASSPA